jgi:hypothetical protein
MSKKIARTEWICGGGLESYQDGLWIYMTPISFSKQRTISRNRRSIVNPQPIVNETFTFLAPVSITYTLNHDYEKYDSIASRAAEVYSKHMRVAAEAGALGQGTLSGILNNTLFKSMVGGIGNFFSVLQNGNLGSIHNAGQELGKVLSQNIITDGVVYTRVDAPLVYKNSDNMRYVFEFELAAWKNPEDEITNPIKSLMKYSCPIPDDDLASIEPPFVFKIEAKSKMGGNPLFQINYAALRSITPTYHQPYIKGHPSKANLVTEFVDIEPVYRETFETTSGKININEKGAKSTPVKIM